MNVKFKAIVPPAPGAKNKNLTPTHGKYVKLKFGYLKEFLDYRSKVFNKFPNKEHKERVEF